MNGKPMLSERDKFESFWRKEMNVEVMDLHRCEFPMTAYNDQPYACHETDRAWMTWKGRAILDKPVLESQYEGMTQDQAQAVSDGVDEILHGKPAAKNQGDPVAWQRMSAMQGGKWFELPAADVEAAKSAGYEVRPLFAEQPAPVAPFNPDTVVCRRYTLEQSPGQNFYHYDLEPVYGSVPVTIPELITLAESAPVAVVMPEHTMRSVMDAIQQARGFPVLTSNQCHALAESLNYVARLNGVKP